MKTIRVNADYEAELFHGRKAPPIINQSLEFLAFFLSKNPILTQKKYSPAYLDYVQKITGHRPELVGQGPAENWWGPLEDLEQERKLNSKLTTAELNIQMGWPPSTFILKNAADTKQVVWNREYLIKDPGGMSGQGLKTVRRAEELPDIKGALILEPLLARKFDFSHYVYPDGKIISYQNLVDRHFQYRGSLFASLQNPTIEKLPFYFQIQQSQWQQFDKALARIRKQWPADHGYSVDSFIYEEAGELYIRYLSEVNYRRTMGATAFELAEKYGAGDWALFVMGKKSPSLNFSEMVYLLSPLRPKVLLLSPDDVRYQMILITADNEFEGKKLLQKVKELLPDCQFAVEI